MTCSRRQRAPPSRTPCWTSCAASCRGGRAVPCVATPPFVALVHRSLLAVLSVPALLPGSYLALKSLSTWPAFSSSLAFPARSDLNAALRRAYLGPKLDLEEPHQLPDCFEADERSSPGTPELLELISGRQLLGVVRERRASQLHGSGTAAAGSLAGGGAAAAAARITAAADDARQAAAPEGGTQGSEAGAPSHPAERSSSSGAATAEPGAASEAAAAAGASQGGPAGREGQPGEEKQEEPDVLELIMADEVVATAVRCRSRRASAAASGGLASVGSNTSSTSSSSSSDNSTGSLTSSGTEVPLVVRFHRGERLLGELQAEHEAGTSNSPSAARFLNADGVHTHTGWAEGGALGLGAGEAGLRLRCCAYASDH